MRTLYLSDRVGRYNFCHWAIFLSARYDFVTIQFSDSLFATTNKFTSTEPTPAPSDGQLDSMDAAAQSAAAFLAVYVTSKALQTHHVTFVACVARQTRLISRVINHPRSNMMMHYVLISDVT
jgi:hypothetical protein